MLLVKIYKKIIKNLYKRAFPSEYNITRYGITNIQGFGLNFKDYIINNNMETKLNALLSGLDQQSINVVLKRYSQIINLPLKGFKVPRDIYEYLLSDNEKNDKKLWEQQRINIKNKYKFSGKYFPEVFFYHHGLKLLDNSVLEYIKGKIFLDIGAFHGDSSIIMSEYNPKQIIAMELLPSAKDIYFYNLKQNNISPDMISFMTCGVSNIESSITVDDNNDMNSIGNPSENGSCVPLVVLDNLLEDRADKIGWIKMDIEGAEYNALLGALKIIKKDKPLLTLSIYHTPQEFFELKTIIDNLNLNYTFLIRNLSFINSHLETTLIGIPPR